MTRSTSIYWHRVATAAHAVPHAAYTRTEAHTRRSGAVIKPRLTKPMDNTAEQDTITLPLHNVVPSPLVVNVCEKRPVLYCRILPWKRKIIRCGTSISEKERRKEKEREWGRFTFTFWGRAGTTWLFNIRALGLSIAYYAVAARVLHIYNR